MRQSPKLKAGKGSPTAAPGAPSKPVLKRARDHEVTPPRRRMLVMPDTVIEMDDAPSEAAVHSPSTPPPSGKTIVGRRASIYWSGDKKWYAGKLVKFVRGVHQVLYDDGIAKWYRLDDEQWKLLD